MGSGAWGLAGVQSCVAVMGHIDGQLAELALEDLWGLAVAGVARGPCHRLVAVVAHVLGQFGIERLLDKHLNQQLE